MERNLNPREVTIDEPQGRGSVAWLTYGGNNPRLKRACGAREPGFKGVSNPEHIPAPANISVLPSLILSGESFYNMLKFFL